MGGGGRPRNVDHLYLAFSDWVASRFRLLSVSIALPARACTRAPSVVFCLHRWAPQACSRGWWCSGGRRQPCCSPCPSPGRTRFWSTRAGGGTRPRHRCGLALPRPGGGVWWLGFIVSCGHTPLPAAIWHRQGMARDVGITGLIVLFFVHAALTTATPCPYLFVRSTLACRHCVLSFISCVQPPPLDRL